MGISELKNMLADNNEATAELTAIENSMQTNLGRITDLETQVGASDSKLNEAILSRDKVRNLVKQELGIDEFSADAVRSKLSSYASADAQESYGNQIKELKASSATKIEELQNALNGKAGEIDGLMMKVAISGTDVMAQTKGAHANDMLMSWISENATFDDAGNIVYRGKSGETLYNGNGDPLTLDDRINEIKSDESRDFVFQARYLNGGGAPTDRKIEGPSGSKDGGAYTRVNMTPDEKHQYISKYGMDAYNNLKMV
ncbi:MAG: hypothetical protein J7J70_05650 [Deltaproteobacteria bacterium]|nr:hypothetical protein [Candidatus Tharpellaceae bacterium]